MSTNSNGLPRPTPFDELTLQNDFLFQKVMQNKRICKRLIESILNVRIAAISLIQTQKHIKGFYDSKGVFLDVTVEDEQRTRYNLEMQVENRKDKTSGEPLLPKRTRYYQAMLDADILEEGQSYDKLKPTYIIFICPFDLFHEGRYIYTFRKLCLENKALELDNKATVIFLNAAGKHGDITENALSFLRYVKSHRATDEFTREIAAEVNRLKEDQETRREYMQYAIKLYDLQNDAFDKGLERGLKRGLERGRQEGLSQGLQTGLERGRQEGINQGLQTGLQRGAKQEKLNIAANMKQSRQFSDEAIALATQLTLEQVKAINV